MTKIFKADSNSGDNWLILWAGTDHNGVNWYVTTDHVHGSDLASVSGGAKGDAELIARLLNWYYSDRAKAEEVLNA